MADASATTNTVVSWSPVLVTLLFSAIQGAIFFAFFSVKRKRDKDSKSFELFETRSLTRAHRSPEAWIGGGGICGWAKAAWDMDSKETLRCIGLDSYMFLRFLRLGFRVSVMGTVLGMIVLAPVYGTGDSPGKASEAFNAITLANVVADGRRLWASLVCWYAFVFFVLFEIWGEWQHFSPLRYDFFANGDADTPPDYRYAILVENVPPHLRSSSNIRGYFERVFPGKVRQTSVCIDTSKLDSAVQERQKVIVACEKAEAQMRADPSKPTPQARIGGKMCCGGTKVDALPYYASEIARLNGDVDEERSRLLAYADECNARDLSALTSSKSNPLSKFMPGKLPLGAMMKPKTEKKGSKVSEAQENTTDAGETEAENAPLSPQKAVVGDRASAEEGDELSTSTAFVTFTSLRAKQAAVQCELSGEVDLLDTFPAPEPTGVIWKNVVVSLRSMRHRKTQAAIFWSVGVLFWAVPVTFVTGIANLDSITEALGVGNVDPTSFIYGLVAGLLPVIALMLLMMLVPIAIEACAIHFIGMKSRVEVESYTYFWHQMYQCANLWLILIGGTLFNQIDTLFDDPGEVANLIAAAMPGASVFFLNTIIQSSFASFGMELSMIPKYGITLIMSLIQPEAKRTQRMIDDSHVPQSLRWGAVLPPLVFVMLVSFIYMPIVPVIEPFAAILFGGSYIVYKHQCLHVYAQEFEGGGEIWQPLFLFIMACLYMAEIVFIAYMGIKEGSAQAALGFIPLVCTIIMHRRIKDRLMKPLLNLSLEVAARIDEEEGELAVQEEDQGSYAVAVERQLYGQPSLKASMDERAPLPYRRDMVTEETEAVQLEEGRVPAALALSPSAADSEELMTPM